MKNLFYLSILRLFKHIMNGEGDYMNGNNSSKGNLSMEDLQKNLGNIDKSQVEKKLRSMGLKDIADKLSRTSNEEILELVSKNPDILRKINQLMGGR